MGLLLAAQGWWGCSPVGSSGTALGPWAPSSTSPGCGSGWPATESPELIGSPNSDAVSETWPCWPSWSVLLSCPSVVSMSPHKHRSPEAAHLNGWWVRPDCSLRSQDDALRIHPDDRAERTAGAGVVRRHRRAGRLRLRGDERPLL